MKVSNEKALQIKGTDSIRGHEKFKIEQEIQGGYNRNNYLEISRCACPEI